MIVRTKKDIHERIYGDRVHTSLVPDKEYRVLCLEDDDYRILDENRQPLLFPKGAFDVVDETKPFDWISVRYRRNQSEYWRPAELLSLSF